MRLSRFFLFRLHIIVEYYFDRFSREVDAAILDDVALLGALHRNGEVDVPDHIAVLVISCERLPTVSSSTLTKPSAL